MFRKILLPTDGSPLSLAAATDAVKLAALARAPLHAVFVQEPYPFTGIGQTDRGGRQQYLADAQRHAADAFAHIGQQADAAAVAWHSEIAEGGSVAEQIVDAAERSGADVIVMASHGRSGVARMLLGSVASKVLTLSPLPVLIVRQGP